MLTDDEYLDLFKANGELTNTLRTIYELGYAAGSAIEIINDFEVIDGEQENK
jgi:hypothetical protein